MCLHAYADIRIRDLVSVCVPACVCTVCIAQWCSGPLTKQAGWMRMGCDSDSTTPHYQLTPAEMERGGQVGLRR